MINNTNKILIFISVMTAIIGIGISATELLKGHIANKAAEQSRQFEIINSTLSFKGLERQVMLRYLADTIEDHNAKAWAKNELALIKAVLDQESQKEKETKKLSLLLDQLTVGTSELSNIKLEASHLLEEIVAKKNSIAESELELDRAKVIAGIDIPTSGYTGYIQKVTVEVDWPESQKSITSYTLNALKQNTVLWSGQMFCDKKTKCEILIPNITKPKILEFFGGFKIRRIIVETYFDGKKVPSSDKTYSCYKTNIGTTCDYFIQ